MAEQWRLASSFSKWPTVSDKFSADKKKRRFRSSSFGKKISEQRKKALGTKAKRYSSVFSSRSFLKSIRSSKFVMHIQALSYVRFWNVFQRRQTFQIVKSPISFASVAKKSVPIGNLILRTEKRRKLSIFFFLKCFFFGTNFSVEFDERFERFVNFSFTNDVVFRVSQLIDHVMTATIFGSLRKTKENSSFFLANVLSHRNEREKPNRLSLSRIKKTPIDCFDKSSSARLKTNSLNFRHENKMFSMNSLSSDATVKPSRKTSVRTNERILCIAKPSQTRFSIAR